MSYSKYDELNDAVWLQERIDDGKSIPEIADELGCDRKAVANHVVRHDLDHDYRIQETAGFEPLDDPEWLREKIEDEGWSTQDVADHIDRPRPTVESWRVRYGIASARPDGDSDDSGVPNFHSGDGWEVTDDFGACETGTDSTGTSTDVTEWPEWAKTGQPWRDKGQLKRAYLDYYWSADNIAALFEGVTSHMVREELRKHDIPVRDTATANKVSGMWMRGCSVEQVRREMTEEQSSTPDESPWKKYFEATD